MNPTRLSSKIIRGILFDFDDTLSPGPKGGFENWEEVAKRFNLTPKEVEKGKRFVKKIAAQFYNSQVILPIKTLTAEKKQHRGYFTKIAGLLGLEKTDYVNFMTERRMGSLEFLLYPEVLKTLQALKRKDVKLGLLTDSLPSGKNIFRRLSFEQLFDILLISCNLGINKLNPKTYYLALKKLNISPAETLFIDNKIANLKVALKLGIGVLLMDRENVLRGFTEFPRIKSLDEVMKYTYLTQVCSTKGRKS